MECSPESVEKLVITASSRLKQRNYLLVKSIPFVGKYLTYPLALSSPARYCIGVE